MVRANIEILLFLYNRMDKFSNNLVGYNLVWMDGLIPNRKLHQRQFTVWDLKEWSESKSGDYNTHSTL